MIYQTVYLILNRVLTNDNKSQSSTDLLTSFKIDEIISQYLKLSNNFYFYIVIILKNLVGLS